MITFINFFPASHLKNPNLTGMKLYAQIIIAQTRAGVDSFCMRASVHG